MEHKTEFDLQSAPLAEWDPELNDIIEHEKCRQWKGLELIASENFTSRAVMECMGSALTNKYSEGLPGARYYGGNEFIDQIEVLCQKRALQAFNLNPAEWGVNVQPYSGSPANLAAYTGILKPNDRLMGLDLPSGGHLTHGFYRPVAKNSKKRGSKKISSTSIFFQSMPYRVSSETGLIDYDELERMAKVFCPKLIVCGASAYPREWDYARLRKIADDIHAFLLMDMAHIAGLVAAQVVANPFEYCHVVTSTTHKTLRGPRAGVIFFRKNYPDFDFESRINAAVFPGCQGGPHNHAIAAMATQFKQVASPQWKEYAKQVKANAKSLADTLLGKGYTLVTGGTDNHLVLWDLRPQDMTGSKFEYVCDECSITLNKNSIYGDVSAMTPGGVRVGAPALTSRGLKEKDFQQVAEFLHECMLLAKDIQVTSGKKLDEFKKAVKASEKVKELKSRVEKFAKSFYMPGLDPTKFKYQEQIPLPPNLSPPSPDCSTGQ